MTSSRRQFLRSSVLGLGALGALSPNSPAAEKPAVKSQSFVTGRSTFRLGTITYNIGKDWDVPTLIKNCTEAKYEGVELRTGHKHGVEVALSKDERAEVKKRFADSPVLLWSLGSAFDFHTPDQAKLRKDIDATKEYITLAHDVGATGVKVRPNALPKEVPEEKTLEQIGLALRELGEFGAGLGQQIRLEIHGTETQHVPRCKKIIDFANHPNVGFTWNSNQTDLEDGGFDANFDSVKNKIFTVHLRDLYLEEYPFRRLFAGLKGCGFTGFTFAEIPDSPDPVRIMKYFRSLWLAYQDLL
ncbi:MAG TPA: sugar phosphate isomerase/epimerase [Chthoniobacteraceae bacterium]|jgi:sugar phosphate isomerase/epimerase|nr:sugar phosphate isomerase/epimerase [Chthoniobacteraceae bacterium]